MNYKATGRCCWMDMAQYHRLDFTRMDERRHSCCWYRLARLQKFDQAIVFLMTSQIGRTLNLMNTANPDSVICSGSHTHDQNFQALHPRHSIPNLLPHLHHSYWTTVSYSLDLRPAASLLPQQALSRSARVYPALPLSISKHVSNRPGQGTLQDRSVSTSVRT